MFKLENIYRLQKVLYVHASLQMNDKKNLIYPVSYSSCSLM